MFRQAEKEDLTAILNITKENKYQMNVIEKIKQWDDGYPNLEVFEEDLAKQQLYVYDDKGIKGFIVLNHHEYPMYNQVKWRSEEKPLVIHRFAVDLKSQGKGYGSLLLEKSIQKAKDLGYDYVKTDTSSANEKMNALIKKNGFIFCGTMDLKQDNNYPLWNCYDYIIEKN